MNACQRCGIPQESEFVIIELDQNGLCSACLEHAEKMNVIMEDHAHYDENNFV